MTPLAEHALDDAAGLAEVHAARELFAQGIDARPVVPDRAAKSVSHETTFADDISDMTVLQAWLLELTEQVSRRLRHHQRKGKTVTLKVRYGDFHTITRARSLTEPTNSTDLLWQTATELLRSELPCKQLVVRLLGMGVSNLDSAAPQQFNLFEDERDQRGQQLDSATDRIRQQFGNDSLRRASALQHAVRMRPSPPKPD